jgi:hypothetical protein
MRPNRPENLDQLATYIPRFLSLVGRERWLKRADHLDAEQKRSPFRWKIVSDYHWLELAISFQSEVLRKEGRLLPELTDLQSRAGLHFAATVVEIHDQLSMRGQKVLLGRLRDALKAETGLAALYLEMDIAQRLMIGGFELEFPDLEGTGQHDLGFMKGGFAGEVECKSLSVDAGRKIHRKDFYRFIEAVTPAFQSQMSRKKREILLVMLNDRLPANQMEQKDLRRSVTDMLLSDDQNKIEKPTFRIQRQDFDRHLPNVPITDQGVLNSACQSEYGQNCHAAGAMTDHAGCLIVMRSDKEDDTSKPLLEAMRKAASQFTGSRPAFIAVQFDEIEPADLLLPHVRRRAAILSYALFHHYGAAHVNATCFSSYDGLVEYEGNISTPAFAIPNRQPKFAIEPSDAAPFLAHIPDQQFADMIGAPLPTQNISNLSFDPG